MLDIFLIGWLVHYLNQVAAPLVMLGMMNVILSKHTLLESGWLLSDSLAYDTLPCKWIAWITIIASLLRYYNLAHDTFLTTQVRPYSHAHPICTADPARTTWIACWLSIDQYL